MQESLVQAITSITKQDTLAQRSCPACFGVSSPRDISPSQSSNSPVNNLPQNCDNTLFDDPPHTNNPPHVNIPLHESNNQEVNNPPQPSSNQFKTPSLPIDNHQIFICMDGNFQHRHHERASKNYLPVENHSFFIRPEEITNSNAEILEAERAKKVSQTAKDRCTEQHKAADDRRNASSWKGCDDTGLFGCCCRHDSVILFCNIHKTGEGRGLPMSILKRLFEDINPDVKVGVLYDIGCTLKKFFEARSLLPDHLPRTKFATAVFHSYVHD
ncbi:hypothetical protein PTTG_29777 [Puccinia triticina 1-1 BBBD Race 1]|uniref:Uncharacterized protein n=1 Tax=Puccinia triticina (isolate 1-1 / race 1 (BBBD)) TaxID=630390 RepID=A0A180G1Z1_PUCT1|nr:hypothetical protein PTTG_29777 [Puccinia triticina 1-1 BBBD Race 1]